MIARFFSRGAVTSSTGQVPALTKTPKPAAETPVVVQFLVGYAALWVILTLGTESKNTSGLAAAFAVAIATGSTVLYLSSALANLNLIAPASASMDAKKGGTA